MTPVFIALGANLDEPLKQIHQAVTALRQLPDSRFVACSPLYASSPMGPADQPDYVNAVVQLETSLTPHALLDATQQIEQQQGRVRKAERWGPRTLDLDLLLYGNQMIDDARLTVPHYGMKQRAFVLIPLFDLAPALCLPCGTQLQTLIATCDRSGLQPLAENL
jgi:2-amino-4-hydroxy-6-hydroxymethyldihydropteridine diphosphokinase